MRPIQAEHVENSRLRLIFDDAVVSCGLAFGATGEDIARTLGDLEPMHYGDPIAIFVTLGSRKRK
ncbi:MAG TPA: hypothetical protein VN809_12290 [Telmatospirillum sp.]|nr:hypothetical protein [Telmatospirillum sp.]